MWKIIMIVRVSSERQIKEISVWCILHQSKVIKDSSTVQISIT